MSSKKEDILETAERLFYEYGFSGVGIKQIINEANVANMTLYNHFASKEELVKEVLKKREERYWYYLDTYQSDQNNPPLINLVLAHGHWLERESPQGDMFLRAIEDFTGINAEVEAIARGHKSNLLNYLKKISAKVDSSKKDELAYSLTLLLEGTTSMTTLIGAREATNYAVKIAKKILT